MLYLVTGGAGFIGSHLCDALVARGDTVRVLDDLSTGRRENLPPQATLIEGDVTDPVAVHAALEGVDGCFHLAAIASVERGITDWVGTHRVNLTGTVTLFDAIRRQPIPMVYASSAAVYGDAAEMPIGEQTAPRPLSAYGADKLACELHARVAGHVHRIPSIGLRFFNVYGPRQDPRSPYSGVISIFARRILAGEPLDVFGDGQQTRDFIAVDDIVAGLLAALPKATAAAPVFNLCTGRATTVLELACVLGHLAGQPADIRHRPPRTGEIRHSVGSPERARAALALPDAMSLQAGLRKVLDWMAQQG